MRVVAPLTPKARPELVSVLSYNALAPSYVRPVDRRTGTVQAFAAFGWCADEVLDWKKRSSALRDQVKRAKADVVCLQEVEFEVDGAGAFVLPAWCRGIEGYAASVVPAQRELDRLAARNERVLGARRAVGNAILVRDGWCVAWAAEPICTRLVAGLTAEQQGDDDDDDDETSPASFAVACVHLDASDEGKRVQVLARARELAVERLGAQTRLVVAGDLNAELKPGSALLAALEGEAGSAVDRDRECRAALRLADTDVSLDAAQVAEWAELVDGARLASARLPLRRVPTGSTRAGYDVGRDEGPCVGFALDHLLYSPAGLSCVERGQTLEDLVSPGGENDDVIARGLPNDKWPSDHLPVSAAFEVIEWPALDPTRAGALAVALEAALETMAEDRTVTERRIAAMDAEDAADDDDDDPGWTKKKTKKRKPTPEEIARKQERRKLGRDCRARGAEARSAFVASLGNDAERAWLETTLRVQMPADPLGTLISKWAKGDSELV